MPEIRNISQLYSALGLSPLPDNPSPNEIELERGTNTMVGLIEDDINRYNPFKMDLSLHRTTGIPDTSRGVEFLRLEYNKHHVEIVLPIRGLPTFLNRVKTFIFETCTNAQRKLTEKEG